MILQFFRLLSSFLFTELVVHLPFTFSLACSLLCQQSVVQGLGLSDFCVRHIVIFLKRWGKTFISRLKKK